MIKEITVFTNGESADISTWSNVPFFFTQTLIKKGIKVNRINIYPQTKFEIYFNRFIVKILNRLYKKNNTYNYFRSPFHFYKTRKKISQSIKKHSNSDAFLFFTFSFSAAGLTSKKIIQFGDWTYDYYFKYFIDRPPNPFEKASIKRENSQIEGSDLCLAFVSATAEYMNNKYSTPVLYLGNAINSIYTPDKEEIMKVNEEFKNILFIGSMKYIQSARDLIEAFKIVKNTISNAKLHIVGLLTDDFEDLPEGVFCHGYLDKAIKQEQDLYYELMKTAKVFVNSSPKWASFSSSLEAMYFYTPVLVPPYQGFLEIFGSDFKGGHFYDENFSFAEQIVNLIEDKNYTEMCEVAHQAVKKFTWDSYIDKVLSEIEKIQK